jgi:hypothetical protein
MYDRHETLTTILKYAGALAALAIAVLVLAGEFRCPQA